MGYSLLRLRCQPPQVILIALPAHRPDISRRLTFESALEVKEGRGYRYDQNAANLLAAVLHRRDRQLLVMIPNPRTRLELIFQHLGCIKIVHYLIRILEDVSIILYRYIRL